jgi:hypothetical protein
MGAPDRIPPDLAISRRDRPVEFAGGAQIHEEGPRVDPHLVARRNHRTPPLFMPNQQSPHCRPAPGEWIERSDLRLRRA